MKSPASRRRRFWPWSRTPETASPETAATAEQPTPVATEVPEIPETAVDDATSPDIVLPSEESASRIDAGRDAIDREDWAEAARIFGQRAMDAPEKAINHKRHIRSLIKLERYSEAVVAAEIAMEQHSDEAEFLQRRLWLLDRLDMTEPFQRLLARSDAAALIRDNGTICLIVGRHFWNHGQLDRARGYFEACLTDPKTSQRAEIHLARLDYRAGQFEASAKQWQKIAAAGRDHPVKPEEPYLFLGRIALKIGDRQAAEAHFERANAFAPAVARRTADWLAAANQPEPVPEIEPADTPSGDETSEVQPTVPVEGMNSTPLPSAPDPAPVSAEESVPDPILDGGIAPNRSSPETETGVEISLETARAHLDEGRYPEALATSSALIAGDPENPELLEIAGFAGNRCGEWQKAATAWQHLSDLQPHRTGPLFQAATANEQLGDRAKVLDIGRRILEIDQRNELAMTICARQFSRMGDLAGLKGFASEIGQLDPMPLADRLVTTLADGFIGLGAREEASFWVDRALEKESPSDNIVLRKARLHYGMGEMEASATLWRRLLQAPESVVRAFEPHVFLARCAQRTGDIRSAIDHFREAIAHNPSHIDSRDGLVGALLRSGDIAGADKENEQFRRQFPDEPKPLITRVTIGYRMGDPAETEKRYRQSIRRLIDQPDALIQLGRTIESQRDDRRARDHWQTASKAFPDNPDILQRLLVQQFSAADNDQAARLSAEKLLQVSPNNETGLSYLGALHQRLGSMDEADEVYQRGMELYPANIGFWIGHATALMRADKVTQARDLVDQARAFSDAADPIALADLARLAEVADLPDQAEALFDQALELAPANTQLWRRGIRFNMNRGAVGKAWGMAQQARRFDRRDAIITGALVQTSAVLQMLNDDWPETEQSSIDGVLMPDHIFPFVANRQWTRPPSTDTQPRRGAMLITSSLGSGGSERQVMFSMQAFGRVDHGYDDISLVARSLNANHKHDFFLPLVQQSGYPVIDLSAEEPIEFVRRLGSQTIPNREAIRIAASMPPEVLAMALPLLGVFLQHRPEVVHLWQDTVNIAGGLAALLAGVPRIIMGTRSTRPDARRRMRRYLEPGYHAMLALPQVTMVNNSRNGARDYEDWLDLPAGSVGVIHNGFDVDQIRAAAEQPQDGDTPASVGIPKDAPVIGGVMRFSEEKRPELFVDAAIELAPRMPHLHFLLIGDGPLRAELRAKVAAAGLEDRIHLPGAKRPVEPWMKRMSILVLTSRMEGLPNVLIEAQILGVPVAATLVGGVPETMQVGKTGITVDSDDAIVLADHLQDMIADPDRLAHMGKAAAEWAGKTFSLEGMIQNTMSFYGLPGD